jgi:hypothetical protein
MALLIDSVGGTFWRKFHLEAKRSFRAFTKKDKHKIHKSKENKVFEHLNT